MMSMVTVFEIGCTVDATGKAKLELSREDRLVSGELELGYPPNGEIDEYAQFEVADPPGWELEVGWEGPGGMSGRWAKADGISTSPPTDTWGTVSIIAKPKVPGETGGGASTVKIDIRKPGKGDPPV